VASPRVAYGTGSGDRAWDTAAPSPPIARRRDRAGDSPTHSLGAGTELGTAHPASARGQSWGQPTQPRHGDRAWGSPTQPRRRDRAGDSPQPRRGGRAGDSPTQPRRRYRAGDSPTQPRRKDRAGDSLPSLGAGAELGTAPPSPGVGTELGAAHPASAQGQSWGQPSLPSLIQQAPHKALYRRRRIDFSNEISENSLKW
jgi:hypothetical protein